ncbi:MAG: hypothetical protein MUO94_08995 [Thermoplasmata archaeon]|nr:hypothetical protein [Thermoplasmata archaeon]
MAERAGTGGPETPDRPVGAVYGCACGEAAPESPRMEPTHRNNQVPPFPGRTWKTR